MDDHQILYEQALNAIQKLFGDSSVPQEKTREDLNTLIGEIQVLLDTLD